MSAIRDLLEQKRGELKRARDRVQKAKAKLDEATLARDQLQTEIAELQAYLDAKGTTP